MSTRRKALVEIEDALTGDGGLNDAYATLVIRLHAHARSLQEDDRDVVRDHINLLQDQALEALRGDRLAVVWPVSQNGGNE